MTTRDTEPSWRRRKKPAPALTSNRPEGKNHFRRDATKNRPPARQVRAALRSLRP